jgi:ABC-type protease/lipase transport system fused ATPase/permease subunit
MYDISTEASRAKSAEGSLDTRAASDEVALSTEASRAKSAEGSLDTRAASDEVALSTEASRAKSAEGSLDTRITSFRSSVSSIFNGVGAILALSTATLVYGTLTGGSVAANAVLETSDARKKKDIEEVVNALSTVDAMHPVYYNWIDHVNMNPAYKELGFIAQEVEAVIPNVVNTADDEIGTKRVGYDRIVSLLVAAVKELKAEVSTLRG